MKASPQPVVLTMLALQGAGRCKHLAAAVGGKDAVGAQRDEYPVQPCFQQSIRRSVQAHIVGNFHPGQQLRLQAVGLEGVAAFPERGWSFSALAVETGSAKMGALQFSATQAMLFRREVGVQHHHLAAVQQLAAAGQHLGA